MAEFAADVAKDDWGGVYDSNGDDITISSLSVTDLDGLIVVAAVEATDTNRDIASVKLHSSGTPAAYNFESVVDGTNETIVYLQTGSMLNTPQTNYGKLITPAKTVTDFVNWWAVFVSAWNAQFP